LGSTRSNLMSSCGGVFFRLHLGSWFLPVKSPSPLLSTQILFAVAAGWVGCSSGLLVWKLAFNFCRWVWLIAAGVCMLKVIYAAVEVLFSYCCICWVGRL
ncbi:hypothetical protein U1Q18_010107, partial [Sarracenia purpurea var. burkii]